MLASERSAAAVQVCLGLFIVNGMERCGTVVK